MTKLAFNQMSDTSTNVKDSGAVGDDVTDDFAEIQTAVDAGDRVFFPVSTYKVGTNIVINDNNLSIDGTGTLRMPDQEEFLILSGGTGFQNTHITIKGITVKNAGAGTTNNFSPITTDAGIHHNFNDMIFKDTYLGVRVGPGDASLTDRASYDCHVKFNYFDGTILRAIENFSSKYALLMGNNINAPALTDDTKGAIRITGLVSVGISRGTICIANSIRSNGRGVSVQASQQSVNVVNNYIADAVKGVEVLDVSENCNITGNVFDNCGTGFELAGAQGCNFDGVINDSTTTAIQVLAGATKESINNRITGVVNATTANHGINIQSNHNHFDLTINNAATHNFLIISDFNSGALHSNLAGADGVRIEGNNNQLDITSAASTNAELRLIGNSNVISGIMDGSVAVTGSNNKISGVITGSITDSGNGNDFGGTIFGATSAITAFATGGQGSATQLTSKINQISVCATGGDSVKLPAAAAGREVVIINNGASACDVFPSTSDNLGSGVDTAASLATGAKITYVSYDTTNWIAV